MLVLWCPGISSRSSPPSLALPIVLSLLYLLFFCHAIFHHLTFRNYVLVYLFILATASGIQTFRKLGFFVCVRFIPVASAPRAEPVCRGRS